MPSRLKITLVRSPIGYAHDQRETVKALGLSRMWHTVEKDDTPSMRGMVHKVRHLVRVEEVALLDPPAKRTRRTKGEPA